MKLDDVLNETRLGHYYDAADAYGDDTADARQQVFDDEYVAFLEEVYGVLTDLSYNFPSESRAEDVSERFRSAFAKLGVSNQDDADTLRMHEDDFSVLRDYYNVILDTKSSFREVAEAGRDMVKALQTDSDLDMAESPSDVPDEHIRGMTDKEDEYSSRGLRRSDFVS